VCPLFGVELQWRPLVALSQLVVGQFAGGTLLAELVDGFVSDAECGGDQ